MCYEITEAGEPQPSRSLLGLLEMQIPQPTADHHQVILPGFAPIPIHIGQTPQPFHAPNGMLRKHPYLSRQPVEGLGPLRQTPAPWLLAGLKDRELRRGVFD